MRMQRRRGRDVGSGAFILPDKSLQRAAAAPVGTGKIAKEREREREGGVTVARFPISIAVISDCKMA